MLDGACFWRVELRVNFHCWIGRWFRLLDCALFSMVGLRVFYCWIVRMWFGDGCVVRVVLVLDCVALSGGLFMFFSDCWIVWWYVFVDC